ncbi:MAG: porin family protein [Prevotella sp.]|nr:porin family protein [Prevotella sp.]
MKKLLFIFMCAIISANANAQIWVGGEIGLKLSSTKVGDFKMDSKNSFEINPEIGYSFNDKWAVALRLGYAHFDNAETQLIDQTVIGNYNRFRIEPFVRYTFYKAGKFSFFADGGIYYSALSKSNYDDALHTMGVGINPGLRFAINDKVGLTGHLGGIGYEHSWMKNNGMKLKNDTFSFNIIDDITFGVYVNL